MTNGIIMIMIIVVMVMTRIAPLAHPAPPTPPAHPDLSAPSDADRPAYTNWFSSMFV